MVVGGRFVRIPLARPTVAMMITVITILINNDNVLNTGHYEIPFVSINNSTRPHWVIVTVHRSLVPRPAGNKVCIIINSSKSLSNRRNYYSIIIYITYVCIRYTPYRVPLWYHITAPVSIKFIFNLYFFAHTILFVFKYSTAPKS